MKVSQVVDTLGKIAPPRLAAEWDNVGLLIGDDEASVGKLLLCIDLTEAVLAEAVAAKAMVMAYHPVIFKPLPRLTAREAPVAYAAARQGLAVYAMHTALDAAPGGTNDVLAGTMGLSDPRPLEPTVSDGGCKVVVFVGPDDVARVADAAFDAGAGHIGHYERCAFFSHGIGTFLGGQGTHPAVGAPGRQEASEELRLEIVVPRSRVAGVCSAVRAAHSYETPAIDVYPLNQAPEGCGMGRVGRLDRPVTVETLVRRVKQAAGLKRALLAADGLTGDGKGKLVSLAACCAGSCGASWRAAHAAGATFYLTGEMRHHDALAAAAAGVTCLCLGHSNSERLALKRLAERLAVLSPRLEVLLSQTDRDPFEIV